LTTELSTPRAATTWRGVLLWLLALAGAGCALGAVGPRGGLSDEQVRTFPVRVADAYSVFSRKCSRCHSLARPLSAQVKDIEHWREYVARMRRQPGSGISPEDGEEILVFLKYYIDNRSGIEDKAPPAVEGSSSAAVERPAPAEPVGPKDGR
jgi:hypothetical protein